jgi:hypothetical protein
VATFSDMPNSALDHSETSTHRPLPLWRTAKSLAARDPFAPLATVRSLASETAGSTLSRVTAVKDHVIDGSACVFDLYFGNRATYKTFARGRSSVRRTIEPLFPLDVP